MIKVPININDVVEVHNNNNTLLFVNYSSRDAIISANSLIVLIRDGANDPKTKLRIDNVIDALSDMLYGEEK
jgi:hypothetical protein